MIGNNDSHSKNLSLLLQKGGNELSPLYDLICTAIYPNLKNRFSFKIGDRDEFSKIGHNQVSMLEREIGMKHGSFQHRLANMNQKILEKKDDVAKAVCRSFRGAKIPKRISELIESRSKSLKFQGAFSGG